MAPYSVPGAEPDARKALNVEHHCVAMLFAIRQTREYEQIRIRHGYYVPRIIL